MMTYLLLTMAMLTHLVFDWYKLHHDKPILHWLSATLTICASMLYGVIDHHYFDRIHYWWQFAFFSLCIHFCFFDLIWNLTNHKKWYYSGDPYNPHRAWTDKFWDFIPIYAQPLVRFWFLGIGIGVFYHLDWIINQYAR